MFFLLISRMVLIDLENDKMVKIAVKVENSLMSLLRIKTSNIYKEEKNEK